MVREEKIKLYNKKLNIHNFDENGSKNEFSGSKNMWNTVKTLSGKPNMQPPRKIVVNGKVYTSVKK